MFNSKNYKTMKKYIFLFLLIGFNAFVYSQCNECNYKEGVLWVVLNDKNEKFKNKKIDNEAKQNYLVSLKSHKIKKMASVFPYSKNEYLKQVYKFEFEGNTENLKRELDNNYKNDFKEVLRRPKEKNISTYDPSDYMWQAHKDDWLWHLTKIQADLAWNITKGATSVTVAILDTWFDINHPDLENQMLYDYDPYDLTTFSSVCTENDHGTTVASFVAAETDGGGQLAGIGFKSRLIGYQAWDGDYIERAHHASLVMGADVLTSSAGGWRCDDRTDWSIMNTTKQIEQLAVQEILNNGTIIVMPAGNGTAGGRCRGVGETMDSPFFPLHPFYDERIIIVSSTDINDNHTYVDGAGTTVIHSFYPEVDICAPGYNVMGAKRTIADDCTPNIWPYYGSCSGTSFATPIVAGVCALLKAVNPCITPEEAQDIITSTADPINDEYLYYGMLGAGRINAYEAVKAASTIYVQDQTFTDNPSSVKAAYYIKAGNHVTDEETHGDVIIESGANVFFKAGGEILLDKGFEVKKNGRFETIIMEGFTQGCP